MHRYRPSGCPFSPTNDKVNSLWLLWIPEVDELSGCLPSWPVLLLSVSIWCVSCDFIRKHLLLIGAGYNENRVPLQTFLGSTDSTLSLHCRVNSIISVFYFSWKATFLLPDISAPCLEYLLLYHSFIPTWPILQSPSSLTIHPNHRFSNPWCHRAWELENFFEPLAQQFQTFQVLGSKEGPQLHMHGWCVGPISQAWFLPLPFQLEDSHICFNFELPCKILHDNKKRFHA